MAITTNTATNSHTKRNIGILPKVLRKIGYEKCPTAKTYQKKSLGRASKAFFDAPVLVLSVW